ncbi:hypothetical protein O9993_09565 [Vibrio lentus]|nr:hypothetical protein [Vibrio lentus]
MGGGLIGVENSHSTFKLRVKICDYRTASYLLNNLPPFVSLELEETLTKARRYRRKPILPCPAPTAAPME